LRELKQHLSENTYLTIASIAKYVKEKYKVTYKPSGMAKAVHQLRFVYKKLGLSPGRVNRAKQLGFLQKYEEIRRSGYLVYSKEIKEGTSPVS
jgi:transposase